MPPSRPRRSPRQPPLAEDARYFTQATGGTLLMDEAEPMMTSLRAMRHTDRKETFEAFAERFGPRDPEKHERLKMLYDLTVERARASRLGRPRISRTMVHGRRGP